MMTAARLGYGSKLKVEATFGSGTYTSVAEVTDINGPNLEVGDVEATNLDSPNTAEEYIAALSKPGEYEIELNYVKATNAQLYGYLGVLKNWQVTINDGTSPATPSTWGFQGYIKKFGKAIPVKEKIKVKIGIKVTGAPTFTQGT